MPEACSVPLPGRLLLLVGTATTRPATAQMAMVAHSDAVPARRFPREFLLYVGVLTVLVALVTPDGLLALAGRERDALVLLALMVVASLLTVSMDPEQDVDWQLDGPVAVAAAVLLPAPLAVLVAFCGFTNRRELSLATSPWLRLFNRGQNAAAVGVAALAVAPLTARPPSDLRLVTATAMAIVVHAVAGYFLWSLGHRLLHRREERGSPVLARFPVHMLLVSSLAVPIVVGHRLAGELAVVLVVVPLALGYSAIRSARDAQERATELALQVRELEALNGLGKQLLAAQDLGQVVAITTDALRTTLGADDVLVDLAGSVPPDLDVVKVPGAEPAAIAVPPGLSEGTLAAVRAVAGLLAMSLQRVELADELSEVQQARVELSGQIIEEGTRERSRIALEIHDDVLPYFAAAEIQSDNVRTSLHRDEVARAEHLAAVTQDAIHGGIDRLRDVLAQLRSQIIVPGSLREGLREALDTLKLEQGVDGSLALPDRLPALPPAVEILIVETVRGCLANVAKHAGATRVDVRLEATHSGISATICDDGRGFDQTAVRESSHGLSLMAQRVRLARGHFAVESALGKGTHVHLEVPL